MLTMSRVADSSMMHFAHSPGTNIVMCMVVRITVPQTDNCSLPGRTFHLGCS